MSVQKLIPNVKLEYQLLNYVFEKFQTGKKLEDVSDSLYHDETRRLFERIAKGECVSMDLSLPDEFIEAYTSKTQAEVIQCTLEDLKGRRDHLKQSTENIYNFDIDYSLKSDVRTMSDLVKASLDQVINNPRGMFPDKWNDFYSTIGGFLPGEWIGIAGGSGDGKTTWAVDLIHSLQMKYDCESAVISCEMGENALGKKLIKRSMELSTEEYIYLAHKDRAAVENTDFGNWDKCKFAHDIYTVSGVQAFIRKYKPKFWALDYVGMIHRESGYSAGDWSVYLSNTFKALCKETGTIGIGLYQLDKDSQKNGQNGKRRVPTLADIYGGIGNKQAMDTGAVVYRIGSDHFIYWDKVRDYYSERFRGVHFKANGNSGTGAIHNLEPKEDQFRLP
jgi:hypothetical protein